MINTERCKDKQALLALAGGFPSPFNPPTVVHGLHLVQHINLRTWAVHHSPAEGLILELLAAPLHRPPTSRGRQRSVLAEHRLDERLERVGKRETWWVVGYREERWRKRGYTAWLRKARRKGIAEEGGKALVELSAGQE